MFHHIHFDKFYQCCTKVCSLFSISWKKFHLTISLSSEEILCKLFYDIIMSWHLVYRSVSGKRFISIAPQIMVYDFSIVWNLFHAINGMTKKSVLFPVNVVMCLISAKHIELLPLTHQCLIWYRGTTFKIYRTNRFIVRKHEFFQY